MYLALLPAAAILEVSEKIAIGREDQRRRISRKACFVGFHRAIKGVKFRIALEGIGIGFDGDLVALTTADLRCLFSFGQ